MLLMETKKWKTQTHVVEVVCERPAQRLLHCLSSQGYSSRVRDKTCVTHNHARCFSRHEYAGWPGADALYSYWVSVFLHQATSQAF